MPWSRSVFDPEALATQLADLIKKAEDPELWNDNASAQKTLKEKSIIEQKLQHFNDLQTRLQDARQYFQLAKEEKDEQLIAEIKSDLEELEKLADSLEIESLFGGENDSNNCFIELNAGAGGTDSCDFNQMLLRMYDRFAQRHEFKSEIIDIIEGEEAGIRSATLKISGNFAYGWLRCEIGIHRLVRISPFNANGKRQTSFASLWAYPEVDDSIDIEIEEKDLRVDTYRASGAGGQHVNKTDSAVRITHLPTNTVVQCQSDRSQLRNRTTAMTMLKSRLYELELKKKQEEQNSAESNKSDNSWGNQIRSYVLHPYKMVKDLRTGFETANTTAVLDGELDGFIKAVLVKKSD